MFEFSAKLETDRLQAALTRRFLLPAIPALETLFLELRAEADVTVPGALRRRYAKPYPYGCCMEITADVLHRLKGREAASGSAGERALKAFVNQGGRVGSLWGVLRDKYFQNAIQLGSLYVDVANDTVDPLKPKVEILPMQESGLVLVRDGAHFARIGEAYWGVRIYVNTALPALAPHFPLIMVWPDGTCQLAARNLYMIRLFALDGFSAAEQWLNEGPEPPVQVIEALRRACPPDLLGDTDPGLEAAVAACRRMRRAKVVLDDRRAGALREVLDRVPTVKANLASGGAAQGTRANARPAVSVSRV